MSTPKYYYAENANRLIQQDGFTFQFEVCELFGGCWCGVYQTDDPAQQKALAKVVEDKASAITEVNKVEYDRTVAKKAAGALGNFSPSRPTSSAIVGPLPSDAEPAPSPSEEDTPADQPPTEEIDSADEEVAVGSVTKPTKPTKSPKKTK